MELFICADCGREVSTGFIGSDGSYCEDCWPKHAPDWCSDGPDERVRQLERRVRELEIAVHGEDYVR